MLCAILSVLLCVRSMLSLLWNDFFLLSFFNRVHLSVSFFRTNFWDKYVCIKITFNFISHIISFVCALPSLNTHSHTHAHMYRFCSVDLRSINLDGIMHSQLFHSSRYRCCCFGCCCRLRFFLSLSRLKPNDLGFILVKSTIVKSTSQLEKTSVYTRLKLSCDFNQFHWFTASFCKFFNI